MLGVPRVSRTFVRLSFVISIFAFLLIEGTIFLDQWIAGHATTRFILGTALLNAGACTGLFALISAIGLAISIVVGNEAFAKIPSREGESVGD